ncbi:beta-lactamase superfamily II metal-dependent hydrolase [Paenibacillus sp. V4I5]|nr:beta-lactamase superfamily II metal-dependent hydrolase [Paenibacillus sp. V4I5]
MKLKVCRVILGLLLVLAVTAPSSFVFPQAALATAGILKVHMLSQDDGRNDSFIFELPNGEVMVVDNQNGSALVSKLNSLGINSVKYVVGTHQHVDHIGGLDDFINSGFLIDNTKIYYPDGAIHRTNTEYTNLKNAADNRNLTMEYLWDNEYILNTTYDNKPLIIKAIGPLYWRVNGGSNDYTNVNDASLVLKITYGTKSILMMGDAKSLTESDLMTYRNGELDGIQVLKVGHHGIKDVDQWAASEAFLDRLGVTKALITNGTHDIAVTVVNRLQSRNVPYWTTGQNGVRGPDVMLSSDGTNDWTTTSDPYWELGDTGTTYYFIEHAGDPIDTDGLRRMYNDTSIGSDVATSDSQWGGYHIRWQLIDAGGGYYYIQNMKFGTRLYSTADGSDVYQVPGSTTSDNVKWKMTNYNGTWIFIDNKANGYRLHSKTEEDWLVRLTSSTYTNTNVQWKLVPIPLGS